MGIKILVVDDSSVVRKEIRHVLEEKHEIIEARDGIEGLEKMRATPDLNLVLLDVNMPRMGGLEMLERLKEDQCRTPVLIMTTEGHPAHIRQARDAGAKAWLVKPVDHDHLRRLVEEFASREARRVG